MKVIRLKYIYFAFAFLFLWACSTKKNNFATRNFQALNTEYNVLYNGGVALDKGIAEVHANYNDDFWEILPVERMQPHSQDSKSDETTTKSKNPNFERAEDKATKAIQKRSMNIDGYERNPQIDEAYLMLGKARYYEFRYLPALEAFNYILYKYPTSNNVYQAKVWREKINIKMDNEVLAIKNLKKSLKDTRLKGKDLADIQAVLAEGYIKINALDSAVACIKVAKKETKVNEEKARYAFILGQLYENLKYKDSAFAAFQEVIDLKRKAPKPYTIYAHIKQAGQFDVEKGDTLAFHKKYDKLIADIENKAHLDVLYHQKGLFYDAKKNNKEAIFYYKKSNKTQPKNSYLTASNYRNIATIYYNKQNFHSAKKYFDSTLVVLKPTHREYKPLNKKRNILIDVVKYLDIIKNADSIVRLSKMSESDKINYFKTFIELEKAKDSLKAKADLDKQNATKSIADAKQKDFALTDDMKQNFNQPPMPVAAVKGDMQQSVFYYYNAVTVAQGKIEFQKKWGTFDLVDNWKWAKKVSSSDTQDVTDVADSNVKKDDINSDSKESNPKYSVAYYLEKLPKNPKIIDSLQIEANDARFNLGELFKESLKEQVLATSTFETILLNKPQAKLILPTYYNLYQLYFGLNTEKANYYKEKITTEYPNSRYAAMLANTSATYSEKDSDAEFNLLYKQVEEGQFRETYVAIEPLLKKYDGDELNAKFDMLKAKIVARLFGVEPYKKALQKVVKEYPKNEEAKRASSILATEIPQLEAINFGKPSRTYNLVFVTPYPNEVTHKQLLKKLDKFVKDSGNSDLILSNDLYDLNRNCIVIHGFNTDDLAKASYEYLKLQKEYKIKDEAYVISNEDYKVIHVKKNLETLISKK